MSEAFKDLSKNVYEGLVNNSQKLKTMSFNRQMVKQTAMYSYHSLLHSNKKERIINTCNMDKMPGHYTEWKELIPKVIWYFISLHCIFEMDKRWVITWSQGWVYKREVGVAIKGQQEGSLCWWDILYLDCINVNILLMARAWQAGKANLYLE